MTIAPDRAQELRRDLLLKQEIERRLDTLVQLAQQTAAKLQNSKMEESQLRNLVNVATESRSLEVVVNFVRYQIARKKDEWSTAPDGFGHTVIADLRGPVSEMASRVAAEVARELVSQPDAELLRLAFGELMTRYLGYLNRAFYYAKKTGKFEHLKESRP